VPGRWGREGPPDEAYGRVTHPERFAPVVDAADGLVAALSAAYDVVVAPAELERTVRATRLVPAAGAPLTVGISEFPGARVAYGAWCVESFPVCGCDACDEDAPDTIEDMLGLVDDVVHGRFVEELIRRPRELSIRRWGRGQSRGSRGKLHTADFERLSAAAPAGRHEWPPWPVREE
jgi:Family of unknown function (DUF6226)